MKWTSLRSQINGISVPLCYFSSKEILNPPPPSPALIRTPPTYTQIHPHTIHWFFIFFREKIRKMRFKFSNEVRYQWLFCLYTLILIVLSQYTCRFFVNLHHLNQIRQITPPFLLILFCWIFQSHHLIKTLGYSGPKSWGLIFWKLKNTSYLN